ncbi:hypothetical protein D9613_002359 [Agrocybe pediades]|uniref:NADH:flavin oxidoreductase/NADH oxidase N-terminal domain-containing protein n=1 Tax=Agrocybe pediades TaxID=84607 RepID=A0A8H4VUH2_9AGAR|nr:hypothetical protein D9613_002359 [Agrocybe pediades]
MSSSSTLFQPITVGASHLSHRIVLAPMTRCRSSQKTHVPSHLMETFYAQRTRVSGTLAIAEATLISKRAGGMDNTPGIWSEEQISAWRKYLQLWALGRAAKPHITREDGIDYVAPSPIPLPHPTQEIDAIPRELTVPEIKSYINDYAQAAKNAVYRAGFDGVEVHAANGYLIDQFLQDVSNQRTDEYGGSIANRSRFGLEVVDAVVKAVGADRTGVRLIPWNNFSTIKMSDPVPQFSNFVGELAESHPDLAYLHVLESNSPLESIDFLRKIWAPRPFISCGGYTRESAIARANESGNLIAFGRWFASNPDLPIRISRNIPFSPFDPSTFYGPAGHVPGSERGYVDYKSAEEESITSGEALLSFSKLPRIIEAHV